MSLSESEIQALDAIDLGVTPSNTNAVIDRASYQDPDRTARVIDIADRRGVPTSVVDTELDELERRDAVDAIDSSTFGPALTKFLSKPDYAGIAHDDIDNLRATETALAKGTVGRQLTDIKQHLKNIGGATAAGVTTFTSGGYGVLEQATDMLRYFITQPVQKLGVIDDDPLEPVSDFFRYGRESGEAWSQYLRPDTEGIVEEGVFAGLESAGSNLLTLGYGVAAKNAYYALGLMVGSVEGRAYGTAKDQGMGFSRSTIYAVTEATIEYATEKAAAFQLIKDLGLNTPFARTLIRNLMREVPGEQVATVLQDFNAWAFLPANKDKTASDYLEERPSAALRTLIATMVGTGVQTGALAGINKVAGKLAEPSDTSVTDDAILRRTQELQESQIEQAELDTIITLAQRSKVSERAQDAYKDFLDGAGGGQTIYVSVDIVEALAEIPLFMAEQIDGLGGDIAIPMDLFMAEVANDEALLAALRPHLKMGEDRLSADEIEKGQDMTTRALLERAQAAADIKTEADAVWETVRDQLKATGRVTDAEARMSAQLYPAYATVAAERYGMSVSEVFERMGFQVIGPGQVPGENGTPETVMSQATDEGYEGQDAAEASEWVNAVNKGLDMSTPARMERAEAQGYDTGTTWYHGTDVEFEEFDTEFISPTLPRGMGFDFTTDPDRAGGFGKTDGQNIKPLILRFENPYTLKKEEVQDFRKWQLEKFGTYGGDKFRDWMKTNNYDAVIHEGVDEGQQHVVIMDPSQIRSVNAAFDPDKTDSPLLLAQGSTYATEQDFGDIEISEDVQMAETGEDVTVNQSAQRVFDQTMKRRNTVEKLRDCLNAS